MRLQFCPFPYFLKFTDGLPAGIGGDTTALTVKIATRYKDDVGRWLQSTGWGLQKKKQGIC